MNDEIKKLSPLEREARDALRSAATDGGGPLAEELEIQRLRSTIERKPLVDGLLQSLFAIPLHFIAHMIGELAGVVGSRSHSKNTDQ